MPAFSLEGSNVTVLVDGPFLYLCSPTNSLEYKAGRLALAYVHHVKWVTKWLRIVFFCR